MKILVTPTSFKTDSPAMNKLRQFADEIVFNQKGKPLEAEELIPLLKDCDGYIAGLDYITAQVINSCDKLKVISRYGAGTDRVDIQAAKEKGIVVCNTPGANAQAVADLTMGLIISVARKIPMLDQKTKAGQWLRSIGVEIYGKTIGILGLGTVGKCVAKRAQGFSMKILAYDPYLDKEYAVANEINETTLELLAEQSDVISLHLPLSDDTRYIVDSQLMRTMKPGVILINTARGGLIDEAAAFAMLQSGHIGGLGLDAYEKEPPSDSPLFGLDNVVTTPHTASHTYEATVNMANMSVDNLICVLQEQKV